ncbi:exodeoxyribonuclease VII small subunit [Pseudooceanicola sp. LIPI14-2-Ac024]|uniref:exodeoxyribonuclease VII small subunit n=1 Tax=Pseudooceanicola sp. LIPI14-2-Ac024 TaxID=3344875 RepID=UPI0035CF1AE7
MSDQPVDEMTFEQAMKELEDVVAKLERGDVPLDESIGLYERGAKLKARCEKKLKEAEEKVAAITLDAQGQPVGITPVDPQ